MAAKDLQEDLAESSGLVVNQSTVLCYWHKHDIHGRSSEGNLTYNLFTKHVMYEIQHVYGKKLSGKYGEIC